MQWGSPKGWASCAGLTQDTATPSTTPFLGVQVPLPTSSYCSALWQGSEHWTAHAFFLGKACFAGYLVTCHWVIWGQCCPGQISEGVVLWSLLFFPPNTRNHKEFSTLRNCHEMKILLKNNVPMCFVQCQAAVMLVEQIAHSLLLPCGRSTPEMWKRGRAIVVECWLPCVLSQKSSCFSCPESINENIIGIAWTWLAEQL